MRRLSRAPNTRTLFGDTLLVGVVTAIARAPGLVTKLVVATVAGPGALLDSWLSAFLVPSFAGNVFPAAIAPALVPGIADLHHRGCVSEARRPYVGVFSRAVRLSTITAELARVLWISGRLATVCSLAFFCSPLIVQLTIQHRAFTARDAATVAQVKSWSLLQLPFAVRIAAATTMAALSFAAFRSRPRVLAAVGAS